MATIKLIMVVAAARECHIISWILTIHFCMGICLKKFLYDALQVIKFHKNMFVS